MDDLFFVVTDNFGLLSVVIDKEARWGLVPGD
jgi:hypothetical protein